MKHLVKNLIIFTVVMVVWFLFSRKANPLFLPKPEAVMESFGILFQNGMLGKAIATSFTRITVATLLSAAVSIPIGLLIATYPWFDEVITSVTNLIRYIPVTIFYPLLIMWLGIGESMKVTFLFIATFFYFLPSVVLAVKETSSDLIDTGYTMGMNRWQVMFRILLPYSLPTICESFLLMYGIGWTYVIVVEVVNAQNGLGHIINLGQARGRTDLVFAGLITIVVISKVFDFIGSTVIRKCFVWKYAREVSE